MNPRKIIQISVIKGGGEYPQIFALCDDGTIWSRYLVDNDCSANYWAGKWREQPPLPKDE